LVDNLAENGFSISYVIADKEYDAEYVHKEIREGLNAKTMIRQNLPKAILPRKPEDSIKG
jgi:hypothetical protein